MEPISPPKIRKFPAAKQRRLDQLLEKNSEGKLTPKDKETLERLVIEAEEWMIANAKRLAEFVKKERPPSGATPVTVWVQPQAQSVER